jgi:hypothetical protein
VAQVDELRQNPQTTLSQWFPAADRGQSTLPPAVRVLIWAFVTNPRRELFRNAVMRLSRGARG